MLSHSVALHSMFLCN